MFCIRAAAFRLVERLKWLILCAPA
jgi:hypothetical protein